MAWLASSFSAGVAAAALVGDTQPASPLVCFVPLVALLIAACFRPATPGTYSRVTADPFVIGAAVVLATSAGWLATLSAAHAPLNDCRRVVPDGAVVRLRGTPEASLVPGRRSVPFRITAGLRGCQGSVTLVLPRSVLEVSPGHSLSATGRWAADDGVRGPPRYLVFTDSAEELEAPAGIRARFYAFRGRVATRLHDLFPRRWALVDALILAQKSGLDRDVKEAFALAGLAHLLAISGFHVGVFAGVLVATLRALGLTAKRAGAVAALGVWIYVASIGLPDAAVRAATLLTIAAWSRLRARPTHAVGGLAAAWLVMMWFDVTAPTRIGFQLSFAGALGLAIGARPLESVLRRGRGRTLPRGLRQAVAAGVAATVSTLPLVAWHFERVSLVGVPATLLIAPVVGLAIPGIFAALLGSALWPWLGNFLAGGVEWALDLTLFLATTFGHLPMATIWVPRVWVPVGALGAVLVGVTLVRWSDARGLGRRTLLTAGLVASVISWPVVVAVSESGTVEIVALDVGQGDAIAIRSPRGRWILIDAGPTSRGYDAGQRVVVPYLRRRAAGRLAALILTHPDLDHIGGAPAVFEALVVDAVFDPGVAEGKAAYISVLEYAEREDAPWLPLTAGRVLEFDGAELRVIHPPDSEAGVGKQPVGSNDRSIVLELRFGKFSMLLTGDAEAAAEDLMIREGRVPTAQILKLGHHGSSTSTTSSFLERVEPEVAIVPVGRRNRYGHPDPNVLARLEARGIVLYRTDLNGAITVVADRYGRYTIETER